MQSAIYSTSKEDKLRYAKSERESQKSYQIIKNTCFTKRSIILIVLQIKRSVHLDYLYVVCIYLLGFWIESFRSRLLMVVQIVIRVLNTLKTSIDCRWCVCASIISRNSLEFQYILEQ